MEKWAWLFEDSPQTNKWGFLFEDYKPQQSKWASLFEPEKINYEELKVVPVLTEEEEKERQRLYWELFKAQQIEKQKRLIRSFARVFINTATGQLAKPLVEKIEAIEPLTEQEPGVAEKIASGLGGFGGFLVGPLKVGRAVTKAIPFLGKTAKGAIPKLAQYFGRSAATLGAAEAVSDITKPEEAPKRFAHGALIGSIFSGAGLTHVTKNPVLNQVLSQFGGRALLALTGQYSPEIFKSENLPHLVFSEALNTFFLSKGTTPKALLTGELTPHQKRIREKLDKAIHDTNKQLEKEGLATRLPDSTTWAMQREGIKIFPERIIDRFVYNIKTKKLKPSIYEPSANEIAFHRDPNTAELKVIAHGKNVSSKKLENYLEDAKGPLNDWDQHPFGKIEPPKVLEMQKDLDELGMTVDNVLTFLGLHGKDINSVTVTDYIDFQRKFDELRKVPLKDRTDKLFEMLGIRKPEPEWQNEHLKRAAQEIDERAKYESLKATKEAAKAVGQGKYVSALSKMLTLNLRKELKDVELLSQEFENKTRIPIWSSERGIRPCIEGAKLRDWKIKQDFKELIKYADITPEENLKISKYYNIRYMKHIPMGLPIPREYRITLTPREAEIIKHIDDFLAKMAPLVRYDRFYRWYQLVYKQGGKDIIFRSKKIQDKLTPRLKELAKIYEKGGKEAVMAEMVNDTWGTIEVGNYLPRVILGGDFSTIVQGELRRHFDTMSETPIMSRSSLIDQSLNEFFEKHLREFNIINRLQVYAKKVYNLYYLKEPLQNFEELLQPFKFDLSRTGRRGTTGYSTEDLIALWTHRIKGYSLKAETPVVWGKKLVRRFFAVYLLKPYPIVRNLLQDFVLSPHKKILYTSSKRFSDLDPKIQERANITVNQFDPLQTDYLLKETYREIGKKGPIYKLGFSIYNFLSKFYPLSDKWSREWSFTAMYNASEKYNAEYRLERTAILTNKELSAAGKQAALAKATQKLMNKLGINVLRPLERKEWMRLIDQGKYKEASFYLAKWEADNTNYNYNRIMKGLGEQPAGSEVWWNLLTFTKGVLQQTANAINRLYEATTTSEGKLKSPDKWDWRMVKNSTGFLIGSYIAGQIAEEILRVVSGAHARKWTDYLWPDIFVYEMGGIPISVMGESINKIARAITATTHGTPEDRKRAYGDVLGLVDNVFGRQFVPFYINALGILESVLGASYIEPTRNLLAKAGLPGGKPLEYVDRTTLEKITHAIFLKDPNKQEDVLKNIAKKAEEYKFKAIKATDPLAKAWYNYHYWRYNKLTGILIRYQPIKSFEQIEKEKLEKLIKEYEEYSIWERLARERINTALKARKMKW